VSGAGPLPLSPELATRGHGAALVTGPLAGVIVRLALPAVGSALLQLVFLLIDTFWVGQILGPAALAAISTAGFAVWMLHALAEMIAVGLTAVAARRHGEGAHGLAAVVAGTTTVVALGAGAASAALGWLLLPLLFAVMNTPAEVTELGRLYLTTYLIGAPLVFGFFAAEATFRAAGDTRTPLALLGASVVLTLVLDPLLITGAGPLPALGIAGAAVGAILTRGTVLAVGFALLVRRHLVRLSVWDWRSALTALRIGAPTAATGVFFSLVYIGLTRITTGFGVPALAALGIGHKLEGLSYMVATGFGLASAAIVGQNLGARRADRARRAGWLTTAFACGVGALVGVAFVALPDLMVSIFSGDPAVVAAGSAYLRALALAQLSMGAEIVLESSMGGAGYTFQPMLLSGLFTAARLPLAAWLAGVLGVAGVWWAIGLTAVARGAAMVILWNGGRWQRVRV
jgi:putative MATE family efflux protein